MKVASIHEMAVALDLSDRGLVEAAKKLGVELPRKPRLVTQCSTPGCDRPSRAKGLCEKHYRQQHRTEKYESEGE